MRGPEPDLEAIRAGRRVLTVRDSPWETKFGYHVGAFEEVIGAPRPWRAG
jgi:hypothetical protein